MEVILDNDGISAPAPAEELLQRAEQMKYEDYNFNFSRYINKGFKLFFKNPGMFLGFLVVSGMIQVALGVIPIVGALASVLISGPLTVGWFIVAHKVDKNEPVEFANFFDGFKKLWPLFLVNLVVGLCVIAGVFLLIIPGIFLGVALCFSMYPVYFNDMQTGDAMKVSYRFVTKRWFHFFGFFIVLGLINLGGLIALGIGLFITIPATYLALYAAYQDIIKITFTD